MSPAVRLALFYAAYFFAAGIQLPFWPVWLAGRGLGAAEIGVLLALMQWVRVPANPLLGAAADRARDRRRFMAGLCAATVAGYLLCLPGRGLAALVLPALVIAAAGGAALPLADAAALGEAGQGRADYGRVRLWGTIAFIAATLAGGRIFAGRSSDFVLYLLLAGAGATLAAATTMPAIPPLPRVGRGWRSLLTPRNGLFVSAAMLIQSSHAVYYAFGTLYWQRLGFGDGAIAALWAEGAVAEVLLFFAGQRLVAWLGPARLLALGGCGGIVRWTLTAKLAALPALALVQPLHALTFAAAHLGAMHYIARSMPPANAGAAQALYNAATGGIGLGIASATAGALYGSWGGATYFLMAAMAGAGGALALAGAQRQSL